MRINFINLLLAAILIYLLIGIFVGRNGVAYYSDVRSKIEIQQVELSTLQNNTKVLERQVVFLKNKTLENYEFLFKRNLNFIRKDEIFFRIIDDKQAIQYAKSK